MTSSKSFRATILPSSLSLPSIRFDSKSKTGSISTLRKSLRSKSTTSLLQLRHQQADVRLEGALPERREPLAEEDHDAEPVLSTLLSRRAKTWGIRVSSLLPTLTTQNSDTPHGTIHRKPVSSMMPPPPPPPPTEAPPPPPVPTAPEPITTSSDASESVITTESESQRSETSMSCPQYNPPEPPAISTDMPEISVSSHSQPQISSPTPPTPGGADHITPAFHGLDTEGWTLQTSFLDDHTNPLPEPSGRTVSAQIPAPVGETVNATRNVSSPFTTQAPPTHIPNHSSSKAKARRSWIPGGRSRANSIEVSHHQNNNGNVPAWVIAEDSRAEYNTSFLRNGEKVPELWNENGAVLVYLFPKGSGHGPSFKVPEFTVSTSYIFNELIRTEMEASSGSRNRTRSFGGSLSVEDATRMMSPPLSPSDEYSGELRLYIPTAPETAPGQPAAHSGDSAVDLNRLIAIRNLFAFLTGQPLVGTKTCPNNFRALVRVADLLEEFCFFSQDGNTFGAAVDLSFGFYSDQLGFADCRHSREETLEALILGERMRSMELYNEAFAHAAGKYAAIMELRLPIFEQVSQLTRERLERAHLDLVNRQHNVNEALEQFEFPSLFAGIANSTSVPELKAVRFKIWKTSFQKMRQFVISYYRSSFGSWPPKASNKKNPFAESGLNRLVLKALYSDMCALYDLIVDRNNLTSRVIDEVPAISEEADKMTTSALRNILSEFDRSKPPVLPPIPFDLPQIPSMTTVLETYYNLSAKEQAKFDKKIKEYELKLVLNKAYNYDTNSIQIPFLDQFKEFELKESKGKTSHDLIDHRIGYWLFLYSVLQSLPMLVVDAPGLKFTDDTEYFLCEPPMGNLPWIDARQVRKMWYEVAGGGGYVELSADAVMFSPEAVYHRSHCWLAAKRWEEMNESSATPPLDQPPSLSPLQPPRMYSKAWKASQAIKAPSLATARRRRRQDPPGGVAITESVSRKTTAQPGISSSLGPGVPSARLNNRSVSVGNLAGMNITQDSRSSSPASGATSGATFDDILGDSQKKQKAQKKKSRFF
ncbi:hypothetical protein PT974_09065 [Cladobotryum mycophilum]|uniref:DUF8004 domain-containing protein n=1 Tax=Cladobotryum mycophilum TaxID=491253 RepID=A0ABR0SF36_9HYPO